MDKLANIKDTYMGIQIKFARKILCFEIVD